MIKKRNGIEIIQTNRIIAMVALVLFTMLLILRDVYAINISKYFLIALTAVSISLLNIEYSIYLFVFLIPLYVGLPGNYITVIFLLKLIFNLHYFSVKYSSAIFAVLGVIGIYYNVFFNGGGLSVVKILFGPSVLIIVFLLSTKETLNQRYLCFFYSVGVAVLGVIMLISTLKVNGFSELLSSHFRLGTKSVELATTESMKTVIDPNYYGFFSIASLVCSYRYLILKDKKEEVSVLALVSNMICLIVALIGLSRTYAVCILLFALSVLITRRNIVNFKAALAILISILVLFIFFKAPLTSIINTLANRFNDDTIAGGNGRIESILYYIDIWSSSIKSLFLGIGIFDCAVHCMPLQFLFGGGLFSFLSFLGLTITLYDHQPYKCSISGGIKWHPGLIVFIYSLTVPVATMINVFFPIVFVGMTTNTLYNRVNTVSINNTCKYFK